MIHTTLYNPQHPTSECSRENRPVNLFGAEGVNRNKGSSEASDRGAQPQALVNRRGGALPPAIAVKSNYLT